MKSAGSYGVILLAVMITAVPAAGQRYGQWSWSGGIEADRRSWQSEAGETTLRDFEDTSFRLNLGLRGFVIDPLIAEFQVAVDAGLSDVNEGIDSDAIGYEGRVNILPRSSWPIQLYLRKQTQNFLMPDAADPLSSPSYSSDSTSWGGRLRLRSGPMRGAVLSIDRSADQRDESGASRTDRYDRESVTWSRSSPDRQHHVDLRHAIREYGQLGYRYDDLTAAFIERGKLSERSRWSASGSAYNRATEFDGRQSETTTYRMHSQLQHELTTGNQLSMFYDFGGLEPEGRGLAQSHRVAGRYGHRLSSSVTVRPFLAYGVREGEETSLQIPEIGLDLLWVRSFGSTNLTGSGGVSWIDTTGSSANRRVDDSRLGYSAAFSVSNSALGFSKQLEASFARNEFDSIGEPNPDLPDLGAGLEGSGLADSVQVRGTLGKRRGQYSIDGWLEWANRRSEGPAEGSSYDIESSTASLQLGFPRGSLSAFVISSEIDARRPQKVDTTSLALGYRLWSNLRLTSSWSDGVTELDLGPDIDRERIEGGFQFSIGAIYLDVRGYELRENRGSSELIDHGSTASIRRAFGGWLPIVSAPERRGVIR